MATPHPWTRLGHMLDPRTTPGLRSHVQVPTPLHMGDRIRLYLADRDAEGQSYAIFADVHAQDPTRVLRVHSDRILPQGTPGNFDDDGVMPGYALREGDRVRLYYSGWNRRVRTPYHNATGIAESHDGESFERLFDGPVMDRNPWEPHLAVTPTLLRRTDGKLWCWYVSGLRWDLVDGRYEPVYVIKHATSDDGVVWDRPGRISIPQQHPQEAFSHPTVVQVGDRLHMWFSHRDSKDYRGGAGAYRMGYAWSLDGIDWHREDARASALAPTQDGFDSEMVAYPSVIVDGQRLLMFYNGNGFGRTGVGVAEMPLAAL